MKYQVLARKYRPKTFSTMMGQEHVLKALSNALESERLHHAYLFTGTRGVGKTTVARVLAKALNCEQGISASPCGECPACQEIEQGRFVDLIEVDAASRTKVEDTRELLDNVQYAPTRGRFKIYLIDEVHMLSGHSFNALLKTLEEPPPHVKFLLATTDPQKLPVTILSRCLQFNLKRLSIEQIEQQLDQILNSEGIEFEKNVLKPLAIAADGSMRDALSLLDQSIAYSNGKPNLADVEAMLGSVQKDRIFELITALANGEGNILIEQSRILSGQGIDVTTILAELITMLQRIALCQLVPDAIDDSLGDKESVVRLAQAISPEDIQLYYQIALNGRKDLPYSPQPQGGFEMILLRMLAFKPVSSTSQHTIKLPQIKADTRMPEQTASQAWQNQSPEGLSAEKKTPENRTVVDKHSDSVSVEAEASGTAAADENQTQRSPQSEGHNSNNTEHPQASFYPDSMELPPLDSYGQQNFQEASEQEMALCDDVPADSAYQPDSEKKNKSPESDTTRALKQNEEELYPAESALLPENDIKFQFESVSEREPEPEPEPKEVPAQQAVHLTQITNSVDIEIPCQKGGELADFWHDLIVRSGIKGFEQQLAKHCALVKKTEENGQQHFELLLESVHKHLLNDKIHNRLIEALQPVLGTTLRLTIKECQVQQSELLHTPRRREIHEAEVLQQQAVESINADPKIKLMSEAFGAKVREDTIKPI